MGIFNFKFFKKIISSTVVLAFLAQDNLSLYASLGAKEAASISSLENSSSIFIPTELGRVIETYQAPNSSHTVFLFQDIHAHPQAQKNTVDLLEYLAQKYNLKRINIEAASGELSTQRFRSFPDKKILKEVSEEYLNLGQLTGAEFEAINGEKPLQLYGIEDIHLYLKNYHAYRDTVSLRKELKEHIAKLKILMAQFSDYVYTGEVQSFVRELNDYLTYKIDLEHFMGSLMRESEKAKINLENFSEIKPYLATLPFKKNIDLKKIHNEMGKLLIAVNGKASDEEMAKFLEQTLSYRLNEIAPLEFYQTVKRFMELSMPASILEPRASSISNSYPNIQNYMNYLEAVQKVSDALLFEQIQKLAFETLFAECVTEEEKSLCLYSSFINLLDRLTDLSIEKSEYQEYVSKKDKLIPKILKFIQHESGAYTVEEHAEDIHYPLADRLSQIEPYYEATLERDHEMTLRALNRLKESDESFGAVMTGGFHTPALKEALKQAGYSYVVFIPHFNASSADRYESVMMGELTPFEKWVGENLRLEARGSKLEAETKEKKQTEEAENESLPISSSSLQPRASSQKSLMHWLMTNAEGLPEDRAPIIAYELQLISTILKSLYAEFKATDAAVSPQSFGDFVGARLQAMGKSGFSTALEQDRSSPGAILRDFSLDLQNLKFILQGSELLCAIPLEGLPGKNLIINLATFLIDGKTSQVMGLQLSEVEVNIAALEASGPPVAEIIPLSTAQPVGEHQELALGDLTSLSSIDFVMVLQRLQIGLVNGSSPGLGLKKDESDWLKENNIFITSLKDLPGALRSGTDSTSVFFEGSRGKSSTLSFEVDGKLYTVMSLESLKEARALDFDIMKMIRGVALHETKENLAKQSKDSKVQLHAHRVGVVAEYRASQGERIRYEIFSATQRGDWAYLDNLKSAREYKSKIKEYVQQGLPVKYADVLGELAQKIDQWKEEALIRFSQSISLEEGVWKKGEFYRISPDLLSGKILQVKLAGYSEAPITITYDSAKGQFIVVSGESVIQVGDQELRVGSSPFAGSSPKSLNLVIKDSESLISRFHLSLKKDSQGHLIVRHLGKNKSPYSLSSVEKPLSYTQAEVEEIYNRFRVSLQSGNPSIEVSFSPKNRDTELFKNIEIILKKGQGYAAAAEFLREFFKPYHFVFQSRRAYGSILLGRLDSYIPISLGLHPPFRILFVHPDYDNRGNARGFKIPGINDEVYVLLQDSESRRELSSEELERLRLSTGYHEALHNFNALLKKINPHFKLSFADDEYTAYVASLIAIPDEVNVKRFFETELFGYWEEAELAKAQARGRGESTSNTLAVESDDKGGHSKAIHHLFKEFAKKVSARTAIPIVIPKFIDLQGLSRSEQKEKLKAISQKIWLDLGQDSNKIHDIALELMKEFYRDEKGLGYVPDFVEDTSWMRAHELSRVYVRDGKEVGLNKQLPLLEEGDLDSVKKVAAYLAVHYSYSDLEAALRFYQANVAVVTPALKEVINFLNGSYLNIKDKISALKQALTSTATIVEGINGKHDSTVREVVPVSIAFKPSGIFTSMPARSVEGDSAILVPSVEPRRLDIAETVKLEVLGGQTVVERPELESFKQKLRPLPIRPELKDQLVLFVSNCLETRTVHLSVFDRTFQNPLGGLELTQDEIGALMIALSYIPDVGDAILNHMVSHLFNDFLFQKYKKEERGIDREGQNLLSYLQRNFVLGREAEWKSSILYHLVLLHLEARARNIAIEAPIPESFIKEMEEAVSFLPRPMTDAYRTFIAFSGAERGMSSLGVARLAQTVLSLSLNFQLLEQQRTSEPMAVTFFHELCHKLSTGSNREKTPLFSVDRWIRMSKASGFTAYIDDAGSRFTMDQLASLSIEGFRSLQPDGWVRQERGEEVVYVSSDLYEYMNLLNKKDMIQLTGDVFQIDEEIAQFKETKGDDLFGFLEARAIQLRQAGISFSQLREDKEGDRSHWKQNPHEVVAIAGSWYMMNSKELEYLLKNLSRSSELLQKFGVEAETYFRDALGVLKETFFTSTDRKGNLLTYDFDFYKGNIIQRIHQPLPLPLQKLLSSVGNGLSQVTDEGVDERFLAFFKEVQDWDQIRAWVKEFNLSEELQKAFERQRKAVVDTLLMKAEERAHQNYSWIKVHSKIKNFREVRLNSTGSVGMGSDYDLSILNEGSERILMAFDDVWKEAGFQDSSYQVFDANSYGDPLIIDISRQEDSLRRQQALLLETQVAYTAFLIDGGGPSHEMWKSLKEIPSLQDFLAQAEAYYGKVQGQLAAEISNLDPTIPEGLREEEARRRILRRKLERLARFKEENNVVTQENIIPLSMSQRVQLLSLSMEVRLFEKDPHYSTGAIFHVVNQMQKEGERIEFIDMTPLRYLHSMTELLGKFEHQRESYQGDPIQTLMKTAKYMARIRDAGLKAGLSGPGMETLHALAKKALYVKGILKSREAVALELQKWVEPSSGRAPPVLLNKLAGVRGPPGREQQISAEQIAQAMVDLSREIILNIYQGLLPTAMRELQPPTQSRLGLLPRLASVPAVVAPSLGEIPLVGSMRREPFVGYPGDDSALPLSLAASGSVTDKVSPSLVWSGQPILNPVTDQAVEPSLSLKNFPRGHHGGHEGTATALAIQVRQDLCSQGKPSQAFDEVLRHESGEWQIIQIILAALGERDSQLKTQLLALPGVEERFDADERDHPNTDKALILATIIAHQVQSYLEAGQTPEGLTQLSRLKILEMNGTELAGFVESAFKAENIQARINYQNQLSGLINPLLQKYRYPILSIDSIHTYEERFRDEARRELKGRMNWLYPVWNWLRQHGILARRMSGVILSLSLLSSGSLAPALLRVPSINPPNITGGGARKNIWSEGDSLGKEGDGVILIKAQQIQGQRVALRLGKTINLEKTVELPISTQGEVTTETINNEAITCRIFNYDSQNESDVIGQHLKSFTGAYLLPVESSDGQNPVYYIFMDQSLNESERAEALQFEKLKAAWYHKLRWTLPQDLELQAKIPPSFMEKGRPNIIRMAHVLAWGSLIKENSWSIVDNSTFLTRQVNEYVSNVEVSSQDKSAFFSQDRSAHSQLRKLFFDGKDGEIFVFDWFETSLKVYGEVLLKGESFRPTYTQPQAEGIYSMLLKFFQGKLQADGGEYQTWISDMKRKNPKLVESVGAVLQKSWNYTQAAEFLRQFFKPYHLVFYAHPSDIVLLGRLDSYIPIHLEPYSEFRVAFVRPDYTNKDNYRCFAPSKQDEVYVLLKEGRDERLTLSTVYHEAIHKLNELADLLNKGLSRPNDEYTAYLGSLAAIPDEINVMRFFETELFEYWKKVEEVKEQVRQQGGLDTGTMAIPQIEKGHAQAIHHLFKEFAKKLSSPTGTQIIIPEPEAMRNLDREKQKEKLLAVSGQIWEAAGRDSKKIREIALELLKEFYKREFKEIPVFIEDTAWMSAHESGRTYIRNGQEVSEAALSLRERFLIKPSKTFWGRILITWVAPILETGLFWSLVHGSVDYFSLQAPLALTAFFVSGFLFSAGHVIVLWMIDRYRLPSDQRYRNFGDAFKREFLNYFVVYVYFSIFYLGIYDVAIFIFSAPVAPLVSASIGLALIHSIYNRLILRAREGRLPSWVPRGVSDFLKILPLASMAALAPPRNSPSARGQDSVEAALQTQDDAKACELLWNNLLKDPTQFQSTYTRLIGLVQRHDQVVREALERGDKSSAMQLSESLKKFWEKTPGITIKQKSSDRDKSLDLLHECMLDYTRASVSFLEGLREFELNQTGFAIAKFQRAFNITQGRLSPNATLDSTLRPIFEKTFNDIMKGFENVAQRAYERRNHFDYDRVVSIVGPERTRQMKQKLFPFLKDSAPENWMASFPEQNLPPLGEKYKILGLLVSSSIAKVFEVELVKPLESDEPKGSYSAGTRCVVKVPLDQEPAMSQGQARNREMEMQEAVVKISEGENIVPRVLEKSSYRDPTTGGTRHYFAMEYGSGKQLKDFIQRFRAKETLEEADIQRMLLCFRRILLAVQKVHQANIVHLDLKPENIIYDEETGRITLLDFGISVSVNEEIHRIVGTLGYMAPEIVDIDQISESAPGYRVRFSSDLFSLGTLFLEALTGKNPFGAEAFLDEGQKRQVLTNTVAVDFFEKNPHHPRLLNLPSPWVDWLRKLLEKDPQQRTQTIDQAIDDFDVIASTGLEEINLTDLESQDILLTWTGSSPDLGNSVVVKVSLEDGNFNFSRIGSNDEEVSLGSRATDILEEKILLGSLGPHTNTRNIRLPSVNGGTPIGRVSLRVSDGKLFIGYREGLTISYEDKPGQLSLEEEEIGIEVKREPGVYSMATLAANAHMGRNEDSYFRIVLKDEMIVGGVFDGMGGAAGGEVASTIARVVVSEYLKQKISNASEEQIPSILGEAYQKAQLAIELVASLPRPLFEDEFLDSFLEKVLNLLPGRLKFSFDVSEIRGVMKSHFAAYSIENLLSNAVLGYLKSVYGQDVDKQYNFLTLKDSVLNDWKRFFTIEVGKQFSNTFLNLKQDDAKKLIGNFVKEMNRKMDRAINENQSIEAFWKAFFPLSNMGTAGGTSIIVPQSDGTSNIYVINVGDTGFYLKEPGKKLRVMTIDNYIPSEEQRNRSISLDEADKARKNTPQLFLASVLSLRDCDRCENLLPSNLQGNPKEVFENRNALGTSLTPGMKCIPVIVKAEGVKAGTRLIGVCDGLRDNLPDETPGGSIHDSIDKIMDETAPGEAPLLLIQKSREVRDTSANKGSTHPLRGRAKDDDMTGYEEVIQPSKFAPLAVQPSAQRKVLELKDLPLENTPLGEVKTAKDQPGPLLRFPMSVLEKKDLILRVPGARSEESIEVRVSLQLDGGVALSFEGKGISSTSLCKWNKDHLTAGQILGRDDKTLLRLFQALSEKHVRIQRVEDDLEVEHLGSRTSFRGEEKPPTPFVESAVKVEAEKWINELKSGDSLPVGPGNFSNRTLVLGVKGLVKKLGAPESFDKEILHIDYRSGQFVLSLPKKGDKIFAPGRQPGVENFILEQGKVVTVGSRAKKTAESDLLLPDDTNARKISTPQFSLNLSQDGQTLIITQIGQTFPTQYRWEALVSASGVTPIFQSHTIGENKDIQLSDLTTLTDTQFVEQLEGMQEEMRKACSKFGLDAQSLETVTAGDPTHHILFTTLNGLPGRISSQDLHYFTDSTGKSRSSSISFVVNGQLYTVISVDYLKDKPDESLDVQKTARGIVVHERSEYQELIERMGEAQVDTIAALPESLRREAHQTGVRTEFAQTHGERIHWDILLAAKTGNIQYLQSLKPASQLKLPTGAKDLEGLANQVDEWKIEALLSYHSTNPLVSPLLPEVRNNLESLQRGGASLESQLHLANAYIALIAGLENLNSVQTPRTLDSFEQSCEFILQTLTTSPKTVILNFDAFTAAFTGSLNTMLTRLEKWEITKDIKRIASFSESFLNGLDKNIYKSRITDHKNIIASIDLSIGEAQDAIRKLEGKQLSEYPYMGSRLENRYDIVGYLAQGGMGRIWIAEDENGRRVLIKEALDQDKLPFFKREAELQAKIHRKDVAAIYDFGEGTFVSGVEKKEKKSFFIAMEWVEGVTFDDWVKDFPSSGAFSVDDMIKLARVSLNFLNSLQGVQDGDVNHHDVKEDNVIVDPITLQTQLIDFGLARSKTDDLSKDGGQVSGSSSYLSPEKLLTQMFQQHLEPVDVSDPDPLRRSDLYGMAVMIFHVLSHGKDPFSDQDIQEEEISWINANQFLKGVHGGLRVLVQQYPAFRKTVNVFLRKLFAQPNLNILEDNRPLGRGEGEMWKLWIEWVKKGLHNELAANRSSVVVDGETQKVLNPAKNRMDFEEAREKLLEIISLGEKLKAEESSMASFLSAGGDMSFTGQGEWGLMGMEGWDTETSGGSGSFNSHVVGNHPDIQLSDVTSLSVTDFVNRIKTTQTNTRDQCAQWGLDLEEIDQTALAQNVQVLYVRLSDLREMPGGDRQRDSHYLTNIIGARSPSISFVANNQLYTLITVDYLEPSGELDTDIDRVVSGIVTHEGSEYQRLLELMKKVGVSRIDQLSIDLRQQAHRVGVAAEYRASKGERIHHDLLLARKRSDQKYLQGLAPSEKLILEIRNDPNISHNDQASLESLAQDVDRWRVEATVFSHLTKASSAHPDRNEDNRFAMVLRNGWRVSGVLDGVGGRPGGQVASTLAKIVISSILSEELEEASDEDQVYTILARSFKRAHSVIEKMSQVPNPYMILEEVPESMIESYLDNIISRVLRIPLSAHDRNQIKRVLRKSFSSEPSIFTPEWVEEMKRGSTTQGDVESLRKHFRDNQRGILEAFDAVSRSEARINELESFFYGKDWNIFLKLFPINRMGTTAAVSLVIPKKDGTYMVYTINAGDSRVYLRRPKTKLLPLTIDNYPVTTSSSLLIYDARRAKKIRLIWTLQPFYSTVEQEGDFEKWEHLIPSDFNRYTPEQLWQRRNRVVNSLIANHLYFPIVVVAEEVPSGSWLLEMTDGISDPLSDSQMGRVISRVPVRDVPRVLVEQAEGIDILDDRTQPNLNIRSKGSDDKTVQVQSLMDPLAIAPAMPSSITSRTIGSGHFSEENAQDIYEQVKHRQSGPDGYVERLKNSLSVRGMALTDAQIKEWFTDRNIIFASRNDSPDRGRHPYYFTTTDADGVVSTASSVTVDVDGVRWSVIPIEYLIEAATVTLFDGRIHFKDVVDDIFNHEDREFGLKKSSTSSLEPRASSLNAHRSGVAAEAGWRLQLEMKLASGEELNGLEPSSTFKSKIDQYEMTDAEKLSLKTKSEQIDRWKDEELKNIRVLPNHLRVATKAFLNLFVNSRESFGKGKGVVDFDLANLVDAKGVKRPEADFYIEILKEAAQKMKNNKGFKIVLMNHDQIKKDSLKSALGPEFDSLLSITGEENNRSVLLLTPESKDLAGEALFNFIKAELAKPGYGLEALEKKDFQFIVHMEHRSLYEGLISKDLNIILLSNDEINIQVDSVSPEVLEMIGKIDPNLAQQFRENKTIHIERKNLSDEITRNNLKAISELAAAAA
ncbi:MAG: protein kinase [Chlamydiae bacterium]|nr:protein kinase [Chlamydiota bacterium]MBI3276470.1 protein kinase [Chlamydiota bacterium]